MAAYRVVSPGVGDWQHLRKMTPAEADDFLGRFVDVSDQVIDRMQQRLANLAQWDPASLDGSPESLRLWWEAAKPLLYEKEDVHGFGNDPPPIWWDANDGATKRYRRHNLWLDDGLVHYLTKCVLGLSDGLWLEWERRDDLEMEKQPCVIGFTDRDRFHCVSRGLAAITGAVFEDNETNPKRMRRGGDGGARLAASLERWVPLAPPHGSDRIPPIWREEESPFKMSDVDVSRPSFREVEHWLDEAGHDWDGAWLVGVPEAIIGYIEPHRDYARILEEALVAIEGVLRAEWVEKVAYLVDAPDLSKRTLRKAVLHMLRAFQSGGD